LPGAGFPPGKFRAVLISITEVRSIPEELTPFIAFRANMEGRELKAEDEVAVFNVHGTASHFGVFLDAGKTMADVEEELVPYNVVLSKGDWQRVSNVLETKAQYAEATGD
jgi:hypothetical protein